MMGDLNSGGASGRAVAASPSSPAVSPLRASIPDAVLNAYDRDRDEAVEAFVRESNLIEDIECTTSRHYAATWQFIRGAVTIPALVELVGHLQPDARFRNMLGVPGVRVGNHIAPPSGPKIEEDLRRILAMRDPWEQHVAYETLHPFTDGNGRSGRAIWLHRHYHEANLDRWAIQRGFLHSWYYHTLASIRLAQGTSASGQDPQGLEAKPAGPVGSADAPKGVSHD